MYIGAAYYPELWAESTLTVSPQRDQKEEDKIMKKYLYPEVFVIVVEIKDVIIMSVLNSGSDDGFVKFDYEKLEF